MAIIFDKVNRIIEVESPSTSVTIQSLINAIRDFEDETYNMEMGKIADASGKESLGGGVQVGITLKLYNWKVKFSDRSGPNYILCDISGGNLVAVDGDGIDMNPIQPASYVTISKTSSVAAAIVGVSSNELKAAIWDRPITDFTDDTTLGAKIIKVLKLKRVFP